MKKYLVGLLVGVVAALSIGVSAQMVQGNTFPFWTVTGDLTALNFKQSAGGTSTRDNGTATAVAGAATLSKNAGIITTESVVTAAGAIYTLTLTNTLIKSTDLVMASVQYGTNSQGDPDVLTIAPATGSVVIKVKNTHATLAFNGTLKITYVVYSS